MRMNSFVLWHAFIYRGNKYIVAGISTDAVYPTVMHLKYNAIRISILVYSVGADMESPIKNPTRISYSVHNEKFNRTVSIFKNDKTYEQTIIPIADLTNERRGSICGVIVKVSSVSRVMEDMLYQVYVMDESTQQPIRVSVYLSKEDTQPYFQV